MEFGSFLFHPFLPVWISLHEFMFVQDAFPPLVLMVQGWDLSIQSRYVCDLKRSRCFRWCGELRVSLQLRLGPQPQLLHRVAFKCEIIYIIQPCVERRSFIPLRLPLWTGIEVAFGVAHVKLLTKDLAQQATKLFNFNTLQKASFQKAVCILAHLDPHLYSKRQLRKNHNFGTAIS